MHRLACFSLALSLVTWPGAAVAQTNGRVIATIADSTVFAEGVDADPRTGALYVASVRHGTILEVAMNGTVRDLHVQRAAHIGALLGVRVARDGRTLYATTAGLPYREGQAVADSAVAAIIQVRIADGAVISRWDVPPDGEKHLLGDLAIGDDGTVYASDSFAPLLFWIAPGAATLASLRDTLFRSLQGIAPIPHTRRLIVADYSRGLLHVDLDARRVERMGDLATQRSRGVDGIVWYDGAIIGVQNGASPARVVQFDLDSTWRRVERLTVLDQQPALADEPTIGTRWRGGFVYVANSQWEKFDDRGQRRPGVSLSPTRLMCIPLEARASAQAALATGVVVATPTGAERKGTRSTASVPPSSRACSTSDASSP